MNSFNKNKKWEHNPRMQYAASRNRQNDLRTFDCDIDEEPADNLKIKNKTVQQFLQFSNGSFKMVMVDEPELPSRNETKSGKFSPMAASTPNRANSNWNEGCIFKPPLTMSKFLGETNEPTTGRRRRPHKETAVRLRNFVQNSEKQYETIIVEDSSEDEVSLCSTQLDISKINTTESVVKQRGLDVDSWVVRKCASQDGVFKKPSIPLHRKTVENENLNCKFSYRKKNKPLLMKNANRTSKRYSLDLDTAGGNFFLSSEESSDDDISFCSPHNFDTVNKQRASNVDSTVVRERKGTPMDGVFRKPILPVQRKTPYKAVKNSTLKLHNTHENVDNLLRECESPYSKRKKTQITSPFLDKKRLNITQQEKSTTHHRLDLSNTKDAFFSRNKIYDVQHQMPRDPKEITGVMLRECASTSRADESHNVGRKRLNPPEQETFQQIISNWDTTKEFAESILREFESPPKKDNKQSNAACNKTANPNWHNTKEAAKAIIRDCESPPRPSTSRQSNTHNRRTFKNASEGDTIKLDNTQDILDLIYNDCEVPQKRNPKIRPETSKNSNINETFHFDMEPLCTNSLKTLKNSSEGDTVKLDTTQDILDAIFDDCEAPPKRKIRPKTFKKNNINETLHFDMEPLGSKADTVLHSPEETGIRKSFITERDISSFGFSESTFFNANSSSGVDQQYPDTMDLPVAGFPSESFCDRSWGDITKFWFEEDSDSDISDICELLASI